MPVYKRDNSNPDRPLRTAEVARILGISYRHLIRKLQDGAYPEPSRSAGNHRVWRERDIQAIRILRETQQ